MADTGFESRLRDELAAAADQVEERGPGEGPTAAYLRRVERRRRRASAVAVGLPLVVVVALLGAVVGLGRVGGDRDTAVRIAGQGGQPTVRRVLEGADPAVAEALAPLRRPAVTALDDGFMVWGGDREGGSGAVGAVFRESTGAWQLVPEGPLTSRIGAATAWTGDEVVIAGGADDTVDSEARRDVAAFDPEAGTWRSLPDLPEPRVEATGLSAAGRIVIAGGGHPTGSSSPTVLVGDGRGAWAGVDVGHPVLGGVVVGEQVVVYGFDDFAGGRAPLELSLVDPVTREVTPLPDLAPAEWVAADYVGNLAVGTDGGDVVVVLGGDGDHALQRLDLATQTWSDPLRLHHDGRFLAPERMRGTVTGVVATAGSTGSTGSIPWVVTAHGAYSIDPGDGRVQRLGVLDDRCAGHSTVDDATTFAVGPVSSLLWVDRSCDGQVGLAGQEGAVLLSLGAAHG